MIQSQGNGPFTMKTKLGWCVAGPMDTISRLGCHHIGVKNHNSTHYFTFKEKIKDLFIKEGMLSMYRLDFHESSGA